MFNFLIRRATKNDVLKCSDIFYRGVMTLAPAFYKPEQVLAWSQTSKNKKKFSQYILNDSTFVYCGYNHQTLGFAGIESNGRIKALYVDPDFCRQGIATKLLQYIIDYSQSNNLNLLYGEASYLSKKVFLRLGFRETEIEYIKCNSVEFKRFKVELNISSKSN